MPPTSENLLWELVDPVVTDPVAQDNYKRNNIQIWPTPHFMGRYTPFLAFSPSFIVKNAPILQPTNCGCKFVFSFLVLLFFCHFLPYFLFPLLLSISKPKNCPPIEVCGTNIYGNSLFKYAEGGDKTSQYSYLVVILSNWVPDNWVYRLPTMFFKEPV